MNALFDCPRRVLRIGHGLLAAGLALLVAGVIAAYFPRPLPEHAGAGVFPCAGDPRPDPVEDRLRDAPERAVPHASTRLGGLLCKCLIVPG